ncbi:hypothetical protein [Actinoplanes auranticolor]|uniref:Uncharacterized protein n=1 Tax=Actinoplanes auranticolor TaxID=47988 RepID=A0A919SIH0_9ACTN|nr:hypothetical protein [Actinoplanes auranticolor]GIM72631.1 hypothetical protein Aau02nite_51950 [Actinoplanes auranticolor]
MTPRELDSPATLVWAVRLLFAEAVALAVLTAYLLVLDFTADAASIAVAVALTVFTAVAAVAVVFVARALARRSSHARGPAIVVQLFVIASGGFLLQTGTAWIGALLMVLGVGVGLLCVLPPTTRALGLD